MTFVVKSDEQKAIKTRNALIKEYGGEVYRTLGSQSNPYSNWQVVRMSITKRAAARLQKDLQAAGWRLDNSNLMKDCGFNRYFNQAGLYMSVSDDHVEIVGFKKAKPTTIPYYD